MEHGYDVVLRAAVNIGYLKRDAMAGPVYEAGTANNFSC